jgi:hypothetical protein
MKNVKASAAKMFAADTARHELTVLHDSGLYRHLRCKTPGTNAYWFDITTWPGSLAISGDMGSFTFSRERDMLPFFRSEYGINPHYWAQKEQSGAPTKEYSEARFREAVWYRVRQEAGMYRGLAKAVQAEIFDAGCAANEQTAREALEDFEYDGGPGLTGPDVPFRFDDVWEMSFTDYTHHYLWCCHAIQWAIARYDVVAAEARALADSWLAQHGDYYDWSAETHVAYAQAVEDQRTGRLLVGAS